MNNREQNHTSDEQEERTRGPSLALMYGLLAFALLLAVSFAVLIVLPFYNRR